MLEALELAAASSRHTAADAPDDDALSPRPSREEIAAAWRRWARRDDAEVAGGTADTDTPRRRGLGLPAPRTGI